MEIGKHVEIKRERHQGAREPEGQADRLTDKQL